MKLISRFRQSLSYFRKPVATRAFAMEGGTGHSNHQCFMLTGNAQLHLQRGNIVEWEGDAIVNAANETLLGGAGVDGAIHAAAGTDLLKACLEVPETAPNVRCPTGEARITGGFRLPARHVIHTVGPIYSSDKESESESKLISAYKYTKKPQYCIMSLLLRIAFPTVSCGFYKYPLDKAAEVSLRTVAEHVGNLEEVHFVIYSGPAWKEYIKAAEAQFRKIPLEAE